MSKPLVNHTLVSRGFITTPLTPKNNYKIKMKSNTNAIRAKYVLSNCRCVERNLLWHKISMYKPENVLRMYCCFLFLVCITVYVYLFNLNVLFVIQCQWVTILFFFQYIHDFHWVFDNVLMTAFRTRVILRWILNEDLQLAQSYVCCRDTSDSVFTCQNINKLVINYQ